MHRRGLLKSAAAVALGTVAKSGFAKAQDTTRYTGNILFPPLIQPHIPALAAGIDGFSIDAQGYGSITGVTYTTPAHSDADYHVDLKISSLTSADVTNLNNLIQGMVSASQWQKVRDYEATHASANLSYWGFLSGGGGASYDKTHEAASGFGLSEENQRTIVNAMTEIAKNMSRVAVDVHVRNSANDYAVGGNMIVFTIAGSVRVNNQTRQWRMIANKGVGGSGDETAPVDTNVVRLN